ncbi:MAG: PorV/PorQ family protein [Ignavibacteriae bacterium]|nr:PorV/PorQ family protein [Ignavibacteriota bacterium]
MIKKFRYYVHVLSVVSLVGSTLTTELNAASKAKYAGEFIAIGVGGRALALGGAYIALANDITAGYWNPAGLSKMMYPQVTLMHDERFGGLINYDYGAVAIPISAQASLAISAIRLGVDNIPNTQNAGVDVNGNPLPPDQWQNFARIDPNRVTYFNAADWAIYFSYAKKSNEQFSYGANLKVIRRENGEGSATGIGFDIGAQYQILDRLVLGANAQDVTTTLIAWNTGTNELITPTLKIGTAYFIHALGGRFVPVLDVDLRFEGRQSASNAHLGAVSFDFHGGLEFDFKNTIALRTGYSDIGSLNVGTGIHLPKFDIDYSFAKFNGGDQLDNTHRISLTFTLQAEQYIRSSE